MNSWMTTLIAAAWICLIPWRVLAQDTVQIKPFVRLAGDRVTLADVAELQGPLAQSLGQLVLLDNLPAALARDAHGVRVELSQVRDAIERQQHVNGGRLTISGSACMIRPALASPAMVDAPASRPEQVTSVSQAEPRGTLREAIARRLAAGLNAAETDLRLSFDPRQEELLATPVLGRTVAAHQTGGGEQITFGVRVIEGEKIVAHGNIRVGVLIRRLVVVPNAGVSRGEVLGAGSLAVQERWVPATVRPVSIEDLIGCTARVRLAAGEVIETRHVEASVAVRKGDLVSVDCVSGSVVIRTTARALQDGQEGQVVPMETLAWRKPISVRVGAGGRGVAVAAMSDEPKAAGTRGARGVQAGRN